MIAAEMPTPAFCPAQSGRDDEAGGEQGVAIAVFFGQLIDQVPKAFQPGLRAFDAAMAAHGQA